MVFNGFIFYGYINADLMHFLVTGFRFGFIFYGYGFIFYGYQWISYYINDPMYSWVGGFIIYGF
jgi:hypothetical protein